MYYINGLLCIIIYTRIRRDKGGKYVGLTFLLNKKHINYLGTTLIYKCTKRIFNLYYINIYLD